MSVNQYLTDYYNNYDEEGRLASRHGSVEFLTTMRYIEKYTRNGDRVLEIGAATGRYSHALARMGYTVDAIELVEHNIELFKKNTQPCEKVTIAQGNAMDLSVISDDTYDITLILGPLYHLYNVEDKRKAVSEALRVTKPGGIIFAAYCISDTSILVHGFKRKVFSIEEYIKKGYLNPRTFTAHSEPALLFELVRKEDIDELMSSFSTTRLHYVATDGYAFHMRDEIDAMDNTLFELFMQYHFSTCERDDMVGISAHVIDVFRNEK